MSRRRVTMRGIATADCEKLEQELRALQAADPMLQVRADQATGEVTIEATSDSHLESVIDRLKHAGVNASVGRPRDAETS